MQSNYPDGSLTFYFLTSHKILCCEVIRLEKREVNPSFSEEARLGFTIQNAINTAPMRFQSGKKQNENKT